MSMTDTTTTNDGSGAKLALGAIVAVVALLVFIFAATGSLGSSSGAPARETKQEQPSEAMYRWYAKWDSLTPSEQVIMCAAWDASPSAAALQTERALNAPGMGKAMMRAVC